MLLGRVHVSFIKDEFLWWWEVEGYVEIETEGRRKKKQKTSCWFVQFDWSHEEKVTGEKCLLMHTVWTVDLVSTRTNTPDIGLGNTEPYTLCSANDRAVRLFPWWLETWMTRAMSAQQEWCLWEAAEWAGSGCLNLIESIPLLKNTTCSMCFSIKRSSFCDTLSNMLDQKPYTE